MLNRLNTNSCANELEGNSQEFIRIIKRWKIKKLSKNEKYGITF